MLTVGMLFSMRVGLNAMSSSNRRIESNRRSLGAHRILESQFGAFLPVVASCRIPETPSGTVRTPYFQGEPQLMRFVTGYSLQEGLRGYPRAVEYFVQQREDGQGFRLLLGELLYTGPVGLGMFCLSPVPDPLTGAQLARFPAPNLNPGAFVLADRLASVRFLYLEELPLPVGQRWLPRWTKFGQWPKAVRVEMMPLAADPTRVQPMSFTAAIKVNRLPLEPYEEF